MAIVQRDLDASQQNYVVGGGNLGAVATGATCYLGLVAVAGQILETKIYGAGLSGAPTYQLQIARSTAGGITLIQPSVAITLAANIGATNSGVGQTYVQNSSLAAVVPGDVLMLIPGGANTNALALLASVVIRGTQDIKKTFDV